MRNSDWNTVKDALAGDKVTLFAFEDNYSGGERLIEGTITKVTRATRSFTAEGAVREGLIEMRANMRNARATYGATVIDGTRYFFRIAVERDIKRLTDPNRELCEEVAVVLRDLHWASNRVEAMDKAAVEKLVSDIQAALTAAKALCEAR